MRLAGFVMPSPTARWTTIVCTTIVCATVPLEANAQPEAAHLVCEVYPLTGTCSGTQPTCGLCHDSTSPVSWNAFGLQVFGALEGPLLEDLPNALDAVAYEDADGDGVANFDELLRGTAPGDAADAWPYCEALDERSADGYATAFARVNVLYCGRSPSYSARMSFADSGDADAALHAAVDTCLASDYWSQQGLPRLADAKIRPIGAVGAQGDIVIGDYEWDYRLFRWAMLDDHDVRDLLLADYHVQENAGDLEPVATVPGWQPLEAQYRAGMITTGWFFAINTMFSPLPRTTAAQAYRAYLGYDISKQQGLWPIPDEPSDPDNKGVAQESCAQCHSTLDPLAYAFASFEGLNGNTGAFNPDRPADLIEGWTGQTSLLFGEDVDSVRGWAELAVQNDAFKRNLAEMLFEHALGRLPGPRETTAFAAVWQALPEDGWSANRLIHRVVDLAAFGGEA